MLPSDLLIKEGWARGDGSDSPTKGECLLSATGKTLKGIEAVDQFVTELGKIVNESFVHIWNDKVCTNQETAVAVLRQAEINCGLRPVDATSDQRTPASVS